MSKTQIRNLAGLLIVSLLMGYALYSEHVLGLVACPLCIFQRLAMIGLGVIFALAFFAQWAPLIVSRLLGLLGFIIAGIGLSIAARHVYIQNLPPELVPTCGPGLDYLMDAFPLLEALTLIMTGSGECAEVSWRFLGVSMPGWVLVWFGFLGFYVLTVNWKRSELS
ncbi:MAG: disulfide bond formation protein B [Proteobacteria bacterium]|nr:disulfide bond formation protein B [Pseudomonadota bacterium]